MRADVGGGGHAVTGPRRERYVPCRLSISSRYQCVDLTTPLSSRAQTISRLLPSSACGSQMVAPRFVAAVAQYLFQWFPDPELEREYCDFAFFPNTMRLSRLLYTGALLYAVLVLVDAARDAANHEPTQPSAIGLRLGIAAAALIVGSALRNYRLPPRTTTAVILLLIILGGLLPNYLTSGSSLSSLTQETFEQTISVLVGSVAATARPRPLPPRALPTPFPCPPHALPHPTRRRPLRSVSQVLDPGAHAPAALRGHRHGAAHFLPRHLRRGGRPRPPR